MKFIWEKQKYLEKKRSQCHFVHHKSHINWPRGRTRASVIPGRRLTSWAMARPVYSFTEAHRTAQRCKPRLLEFMFLLSYAHTTTKVTDRPMLRYRHPNTVKDKSVYTTPYIREVEVQLHSFLTAAQDEDWQLNAPAHLTAWKQAPPPYRIKRLGTEENRPRIPARIVQPAPKSLLSTVLFWLLVTQRNSLTLLSLCWHSWTGLQGLPALTQKVIMVSSATPQSCAEVTNAWKLFLYVPHIPSWRGEGQFYRYIYRDLAQQFEIRSTHKPFLFLHLKYYFTAHFSDPWPLLPRADALLPP
jgi:hypothetical protein